MDPLSIVASAIAVCQAGERLGGLLSGIELYVNAPKEIAALSSEISNVRKPLVGLQYAAALASPQELGDFNKLVALSLNDVAQLDKLVEISLLKPAKANGNPSTGINRLAWPRKKRKIERIKQQLRDDLSSIQLGGWTFKFYMRRFFYTDNVAVLVRPILTPL